MLHNQDNRRAMLQESLDAVVTIPTPLPSHRPLATETSPPTQPRRPLLGRVVPRTPAWLIDSATEIWTLLSERAALVIELLKWTLLIVPMALAVGLACSSLLFTLFKATELREGMCAITRPDGDRVPLAHCEAVENSHRWLIFLLPVGGVFVAWLYDTFGNVKAKGGANTLINEIRKLDDGAAGEVPFRMAVLVFIGTALTHLTGGSAGREGTALQLAVAIASPYMIGVGRLYGCLTGKPISPQVTRTVLVASLASGFAGIFGVPIAGTIFALEMLKVGGMRYEAFMPSVIGAYTADWMCRTSNQYIFGFEGHGRYECEACRAQPQAFDYINFRELIAIVPAGLAFGLTALAFSTLVHKFKKMYAALNAQLASIAGLEKTSPLAVPVLGGIAVIAFCAAGSAIHDAIAGGARGAWLAADYNGTDPSSYDWAAPYLGLGVNTPGFSIATTRLKGGVPPEAFLLKMLFVTLTLAAGFKGGEVTPLFFIGAALGNAVGVGMGQDAELFGALGYVAVFAGATNTPFACTLMGIELFGGAKPLYFALACFLSYLVSGISGIYEAQVVEGPLLAGAVHQKPADGAMTVGTWNSRDVDFLSQLRGAMKMHQSLSIRTAPLSGRTLHASQRLSSQRLGSPRLGSPSQRLGSQREGSRALHSASSLVGLSIRESFQVSEGSRALHSASSLAGLSIRESFQLMLSDHAPLHHSIFAGELEPEDIIDEEAAAYTPWPGFLDFSVSSASQPPAGAPAA